MAGLYDREMSTMHFYMGISLKLFTWCSHQVAKTYSNLTKCAGWVKLFMASNKPFGLGIQPCEMLYLSLVSKTLQLILHFYLSTCFIQMLFSNNLVIIRSDHNFVTSDFNKLGAQFSLKALGSLNFFLGVEVIPTHEGLSHNTNMFRIYCKVL